MRTNQAIILLAAVIGSVVPSAIFTWCLAAGNLQNDPLLAIVIFSLPSVIMGTGVGITVNKSAGRFQHSFIGGLLSFPIGLIFTSVVYGIAFLIATTFLPTLVNVLGSQPYAVNILILSSLVFYVITGLIGGSIAAYILTKVKDK